MNRVNFLLGIHNHQPIGNFGSVFEEAFDRSYRPFLDVLEQHRGVKVSIHFSGPLIEWLEEQRPEFLDRAARLVERGQVEMLGGGFYEPLLPILPEEDARGQIDLMADYLSQRFGKRPQGIWLTERVWEPHLPKLIGQTGTRFTILDETHFLYAGLRQEQLVGYYVTEREGVPLAVFPILKELRYLIPWRSPEESIELLRRFSASYHDGVGVTYADDGEKFGVWPNTYQLVYEERWLDRFFTLLEQNADWLKIPFFSEYLDQFPATGRIYLPNASYEEMMEWALPTSAIHHYEAMVGDLESRGTLEGYKSFLRGGLWENFMAKYSESNLMHKKMLYVSHKVHEGLKSRANRSDSLLPLKALWKGQCNCAYWHGVFGGLYLNALRHAVYTHLILAENLIDAKLHRKKDWISWKVFDYDKDLADELLVSNAKMNAYFDPGYGGSMFEFDYRPSAFNLTNTLSRREEAYHKRLLNLDEREESPEGGEPQTTHESVRVKEPGLKEFLLYDWYERRSFLDHFLGEETSLDDFRTCRYSEIGDFVNQPYQINNIEEERKGKLHLALKRRGHISIKGTPQTIEVEKTFSFSKEIASIEADYRLSNLAEIPLTVTFGVELNVTLLAGDAEDRYYLLDNASQERLRLNSTGASDQTQMLKMVDEWSRTRLTLQLDPEAKLWRFPLETVSQSEGGFERTYQGSVLLPHWHITLEKGETVRLKLLLQADSI
ncbi:MAG: DUF1926 domain-containing protein [Candidatus Tectomicrobia bacterium]|nr:DUF1926 domain-containing protein [Candidatus Tectomicrobia bacterium]